VVVIFSAAGMSDAISDFLSVSELSASLSPIFISSAMSSALHSAGLSENELLTSTSLESVSFPTDDSNNLSPGSQRLFIGEVEGMSVQQSGDNDTELSGAELLSTGKDADADDDGTESDRNSFTNGLTSSVEVFTDILLLSGLSGGSSGLTAAASSVPGSGMASATSSSPLTNGDELTSEKPAEWAQLTSGKSEWTLGESIDSSVLMVGKSVAGCVPLFGCGVLSKVQ